MSEERERPTPGQPHAERTQAAASSDVAGEAARTKAEKKADKKRKQRVELAGAIIIGIAAVLTAIATYLGSQVDGISQEKSASALGLTLDANDLYNDANSFRAEERDWFFGYVTALADGQAFTADLLRRAMPDQVQALTDEWFERNGERLDTEQRIDDPFESDAYATVELLPSVVYLQEGNAFYFDAQCALFEAQVAGVRGDNYGLSTVYLAIALVLGGIAALLSGKAAQTIVLVTASVGLVLGAGVLVYAGDEAETRADTAEEVFPTDPFDEAGAPLSRTEALDLADELCPQASETAEAAAAASESEPDTPTTVEAAEPAAAPATTTTAVAAGQPSPTEPLIPPNDFVPTEGGEAVAVYLDAIEASASSGSLEDDFADAVATGESLGYGVVIGSIGCDEGAAEALGLGGADYYLAGIYFATVEDATAFADLWVLTYPDWSVALAQVQTFCLD